MIGHCNYGQQGCKSRKLEEVKLPMGENNVTDYFLPLKLFSRIPSLKPVL